jgi:FkbM family methyltransferase
MEKQYYTPKHKQFSPKFLVRVGSSDIKSVDETWIKKSYYRPSMEFVVKPNEKWLDLGANIGAFTVYAALHGASVRAYEAQADNIRMIQANVKVNKLGPNVEVLKYAVVPDSSDGKTLKFYESTNPATFRRHTLYGNYLNSARKKDVVVTAVKGIGFSKIVADGYDCVKMNIEGAEIPIFDELEKNPGIKKLVFEYSFDMDKRIVTYKKTVDKLRSLFSVVQPARKIPLDLEVYPYYPPNCYIFCMNE